MEILLNSISSILSKVLKSLLNGDLGQTLGKVLIKAMADRLLRLPEFSNQAYYYEETTDQRMIGGIQIKERLMWVSSSGIRCNRQFDYDTNLCLGDHLFNVSENPNFITNHDVQYQLEKAAFNSGLALFVEFKNKIDDTFTIHKIEIPRFYNTGVQIIVNVTRNEKVHILKFLEKIQFSRADNSPTGLGDNYYAVFEIRLTRLVNNSGLDEESVQLLIDHFNNNYATYDLTYNNVKKVNMDAVAIYLNENWIHIGANFDF